MSVYSRFMTESTGYDDRTSFLEDVSVDDLLYGDSIEEAYEDDSYEAAMRCVAENTQNYNTIMQACAITEFCYFEENGTEMVYTEGTLESWKDSAIAFFRKVWEKIQSIFKKVLMQFASWSKNDKDFYNKYKKELNRKINNGFGDTEVKVYHYRFLDKTDASGIKDLIDTAEKKYSFTAADSNSISINSLVEKMTGKKIGAGKDELKASDSAQDADVEPWVKAVKELNENPDKITDELDKYRGVLAGYASETVSAKDFAKEVTEYFQAADGSDHESTKDSVKLSEIIDKSMQFLTFSDKAKTEIGNVLKTNKRSIDAAIRAVNNIAKPLAKDVSKDVSNTNKIKGAQHTIANRYIGAMKQEKNILTQYNGLALNALKACSRQSKAVCVKAVTYINKDKDYNSSNYKNESAFESDAMSLLGSVEMI